MIASARYPKRRVSGMNTTKDVVMAHWLTSRKSAQHNVSEALTFTDEGRG